MRADREHVRWCRVRAYRVRRRTKLLHRQIMAVKEHEDVLPYFCPLDCDEIRWSWHTPDCPECGHPMLCYTDVHQKKEQT
jgi:hypothetical protein